ncbi:hypothetical protein [Acinetobacter calcoaceticus]|uniref:hypothetical protein n=1 Tax=Acinetobacter calcoaceticus TaxID=471 RepID=UPI0018DD279D|nr:hypothetical protein [Acinetobacter calcoaceticus]
MNTELIPYVPIAPRVVSKHRELVGICVLFFEIIDRSVYLSVKINHIQDKGKLSICLDQINDLTEELQLEPINLKELKKALENLIYPKFCGEKIIHSPIWNNEEITVWEFQLNQIDRVQEMKTTYTDASLNIDSSLGALRVWRKSLEASTGEKDVTYNNNDLIFLLQDLEHKLATVQRYIEDTE